MMLRVDLWWSPNHCRAGLGAEFLWYSEMSWQVLFLLGLGSWGFKHLCSDCTALPLLTTYQPHTDHTPTTHQPHTNHTPTTYQPHTNHIPTTHQPHTNHLPTTYQPHTNHIPTIDQPRIIHIPVAFTDHILTRPTCSLLPCMSHTLHPADCEKMAAYAKEERTVKEENIRLQRKLLREMERREALSRQLSESESSLEMDDERWALYSKKNENQISLVTKCNEGEGEIMDNDRLALYSWMISCAETPQQIMEKMITAKPHAVVSHIGKPSQRTASYQPLPFCYRPNTDHLYWPHIDCFYWPHTEHIPTIYRQINLFTNNVEVSMSRDHTGVYNVFCTTVLYWGIHKQNS